jgi:hypothetical protein
VTLDSLYRDAYGFTRMKECAEYSSSYFGVQESNGMEWESSPRLSENVNPRIWNVIYHHSLLSQTICQVEETVFLPTRVTWYDSFSPWEGAITNHHTNQVSDYAHPTLSKGGASE